VREIEHRDIFIDDIDLQDFMGHIITLLSKKGIRCYAWAMLSNHISCGTPHKKWLVMRQNT